MNMLLRLLFLLVVLTTTLLTKETSLVSLKIVILGFQKPRIYTLTCDPVGGSHSAADGACDVLDDIRGDITSLPVMRSTKRGRPIFVSIQGFYHGNRVRFLKTYANEAQAIKELDGLYPEDED